MENVRLLEVKRIEMSAAAIRRNLVTIRRLSAIHGSIHYAPALDGMLENVLVMRAQLRQEIDGFGLDAVLSRAAEDIRASMLAILADTAEMIALLHALGICSPVDAAPADAAATADTLAAEGERALPET